MLSVPVCSPAAKGGCAYEAVLVVTFSQLVAGTVGDDLVTALVIGARGVDAIRAGTTRVAVSVGVAGLVTGSRRRAHSLFAVGAAAATLAVVLASASTCLEL